jgi:ribosome-associated protein
MQFRLRGDFIELDNLLKVLKIAEDGARARELILEGMVLVNGEVELRVRKKLKAGDLIKSGSTAIEIVE